MKHLRVVFLLLCLWLSWVPATAIELFRTGRTSYDIVLPSDASTSEQTAARELSQCLQQMSGAVFPQEIVPKALHHIFVGFNSSHPAFRSQPRFEDSDEQFLYLATPEGDILVYGGRNRGTMYGVFAFMEEQLGIRWYTPDFTYVPRQQSLTLPDSLLSRQSPALAYRLDYGYDAIRNHVWCAHNRLNMQVETVDNAYGGMTAYWGAHTFRKLLPSEEYFEQHPEYFSLRDGKRVADGQLCLSHPDVLRLVTERLARYIGRTPGCWGYDVSQNDNELYCQCPDCRKLAKRYGGQSGLMLWFVNQVASAVRSQHPDVLIGTLAYTYTRRPPRNIRPADNVLVRLCNIECCQLHPLDACPENRAFLRELKAWRKLTDKIFIWDYEVNFHYYHLPVPNHGVLASNLQLLRSYGVKGVLEQGAYDARWSEFSEMRQWITAKLLWNPQLDSDSLARQFIHDYYGVAAPAVWKYFQMIGALPNSRTHAHCHAVPDERLYTPAFCSESLRLLEEADQLAAADTSVRRRVRRVLAQAYYTRLLFDKAASMADGIPSRLRQIIQEDQTTMRERGQSIDQFLRHHGYT